MHANPAKYKASWASEDNAHPSFPSLLWEEMMGQHGISKGYTKSCSVIIFHRFIDVWKGFVVVRNNKRTDK